MAVTKILGHSKFKGKSTQFSVTEKINYIKKENKTAKGKYITAVNCNKDTAISEFLLHHKQYEKVTGRKVDEVKGKKANVMMEIIQAFPVGEVTPETAHSIAVELEKRFLKGNYQAVITTHIDTAHINNHIRFNSVSLDFKKFNKRSYTYLELREISDKLCLENNLSVLVKSNEKTPNKYHNQKLSFRDILKNDIDKYINLSKNWDDFIAKMKAEYSINLDRKHITFKHKSNGQQKPIRLSSLSEKYSEQNIKSRINNKKLTNKIPLTFKQKTMARTKIYNNNPNLTYTQKLNNIKNAWGAINLIESYHIKNFTDINKRISDIEKSKTSLNNKFNLISDKLNETNELVQNIDRYNCLLPLNTEYENSLLKERFYNNNKSDLDEFNKLKSLLNKQNIHINDVNKNLLLNELNKNKMVLDNLKSEIKKVDSKIYSLKGVMQIVTEIHSRPTTKTKKIKIKGVSR